MASPRELGDGSWWRAHPGFKPQQPAGKSDDQNQADSGAGGEAIDWRGCAGIRSSYSRLDPGQPFQANMRVNGGRIYTTATMSMPSVASMKITSVSGARIVSQTGTQVVFQLTTMQPDFTINGDGQFPDPSFTCTGFDFDDNPGHELPLRAKPSLYETRYEVH